MKKHENKVKITLKYDDGKEKVTLEVDADEMEICLENDYQQRLSVASPEERATVRKYTPAEFADRLNKDERNNHQKLNRHTAGYIKNPCGDDDTVPYINPIDLVADTTTLEEIEERELKEMLYTYLPKSQADVLWAVAMENVPLTELALREGVSKQAIFNRLTAARKNAKKLFQGG